MICRCKQPHWLGECKVCGELWIEHAETYFTKRCKCPACECAVDTLTQTTLITVACEDCGKPTAVWDGDYYICRYCGCNTCIVEE